MPSRQERHLLSLKEAAKRLDICTKTLQRLIQARELPFIWIGRRRKIDNTDLERFIDRHRVMVPEPTVTRRSAGSTSKGRPSPIYDFEAGRERRKREREARRRMQREEQ